MSTKIKLTKGELKKQRDSLKQFTRYLPTLQLKKQQLQMKILEEKRALSEISRRYNQVEDNIRQWEGLLADAEIDLKPWITPVEVKTSKENIAGARVLVFEDVVFEEVEYDFYMTPLWTDKGIERLREMVKLLAELQIARERIKVLEDELRTTTQRVNLFEKIKIPESKDNIRRIRIYLGDQQANAVGVSKVAKKKVEARDLQMA